MLVNMDLLQIRWFVMLWLWSLVSHAHGFWLSHDTHQFYTPRHDASSCLLRLDMFSDVFEEQSPLLAVYSVLDRISLVSSTSVAEMVIAGDFIAA